VPATMPTAHNAQLSQFTVAGSNFQNAPSGGHFVHSLLTVSDSNLDLDFDGKGLIFGFDTTFCGSGATPAYGSLAETWVNQNPPPAQGGNDVRQFAGQTPAMSPNTCAAMLPSTTYRFVAGANRQQQSQHFRYAGTSNTPDYPPANSNPNNYIVNSFNPSFRPNGAGVVFFVSGGGGTGIPQSQLQPWSLTFTNVSSWTQP
jgi:hypothetical protein